MLLWCYLTVTSWQSEYYGEQHAYSQGEGVIQIRYDSVSYTHLTLPTKA